MIVRPAHGALLLISQPDHAHLARRIMEQCALLAVHDRRDDILFAVGEHDNGWAEEDAAPTVDAQSGEIHDFTSTPVIVRQRVWPRGIARLARRPWAAALVAQHALKVYERFRPDAAWASFFVEVARLRDEMLRTSRKPIAALEDDYRYVRLGDLVSLMFCTDWSGDQQFDQWTVSRSGDEVLVTPCPFGGESVAVHVTAVSIASSRFASDTELREAIARGVRTTLSGAVTGHRSPHAAP